MSIVTVDGTVYYLIIDHDKEGENVYFLSPVTDEGLEHLAQKTEQTENETSSDTNSEADTTVYTEPPQKKSSNGSMVLIVIAVITIAGAGYYFKIYKPKKNWKRPTI